MDATETENRRRLNQLLYICWREQVIGNENPHLLAFLKSKSLTLGQKEAIYVLLESPRLRVSTKLTLAAIQQALADSEDIAEEPNHHDILVFAGMDGLVTAFVTSEVELKKVVHLAYFILRAIRYALVPN